MWWLPTTFKDILDILLFAGFLYGSYSILKSSGSKSLFTGILAFITFWVLTTQIFEMGLVGAVLNKFANVGFLVLVVIFQDEIKKFLVAIGSANKWRRFRRLFFRDRKGDAEVSRPFVAPIVLACMNMARKKTGALIVVQQSMDLTAWMHAGERFVADVNARLIETIFFKNSPMHDGAMVIAGGKITAAGVILPVANNADLNKDLGLRHRAALGLSQKTDAIIIIISEERGKISVAHLGEIVTDISLERLQDMLAKS